MKRSLGRLFHLTSLPLTAALLVSPAWGSEKIDVMAHAKQISTLFDKELTKANCSETLGQLNDLVEKLEASNVDVEKAKAEAKPIIERLFQNRIRLGEKLKRMSSDGPVSRDCEKQVRRSLLYSRFFEEYLAKVAGFDEPQDVFKGDSPYLLVNPKFKEFKLESGDVLISRGNAIVSAAIARIGDFDGHFSHAALVYVDEATKTTYAIEAHYEIGTDVAPIEKKYYEDGKVRAVVYRHKDRELAKKAARHMYELAKGYMGLGHRVPYDFSMSLASKDVLFCTEVPHLAYNIASGGKVLLGEMYPTKITMKNRSFLDGIGVTVDSTFAPADVELDSNLELVAEWRNLARSHQTHRKDAVMTAVYEWMDKQGYRFSVSYKTLEAYVTVFLRQMPLFGEALKNSLAIETTPKTVQTMMVMNYIGDKVLDDLIEVYSDQLDRTGMPMTFTQMMKALEEIRVTDLKREKAYRDFKENSPFTQGQAPGFGMPEKSHFTRYFQF